MGLYYYFYKEAKDKNPIDEGKYAGMPLFGDYNEEIYNPECEKCNYKGDRCNKCTDTDYIRYKITKEMIPTIIKDMSANKHLFEELMKQVNQDYIWVYVDF